MSFFTHSHSLIAGDMQHVLERAWQAGIQKMLITGTSLSDSAEALKFSESHSNLFTTVGCHPTRCSEYINNTHGSDTEYHQALKDLIENNPKKVAAIGECGLDYDRLQFCPAEIQRKYFQWQLKLAHEVQLPLFLHLRNAGGDFVDIVRDHIKEYGDIRGVVHSFDGNVDVMTTLTNEFGLFIGINGCSLKTQENIDVVKAIPLDRLVLETDAPWCEVRPTHASYPYWQQGSTWALPPCKKKEKFVEGEMVKNRNEPCAIRQILSVVANVKGVVEDEVAAQVYDNTLRVYNKLK